MKQAQPARSTWASEIAGVRLTAVQRWALDSLSAGPAKPATPLQLRTFKALAAKKPKPLAELVDGEKKVYRITPEGEVARQRKMGRPSVFEGAWAEMSNAFGGPVKLAEALGCSYQSVNQWALHGVEPSSIAKRAIEMLAKERGLRNPLEVCRWCNGTRKLPDGSACPTCEDQ